MSSIHTYNNIIILCINLKSCYYTFWTKSLVIVLKEFKCICMSYIIINPWPPWIEIYEYFSEFINMYIVVNAWCILVSTRQNMKHLKDHDRCLHNVGIKKLCSQLVLLHEHYLIFKFEELMVCKLQFFSIYSFLYVLFDSHKIFMLERS
jgi:hypothetical protein